MPGPVQKLLNRSPIPHTPRSRAFDLNAGNVEASRTAQMGTMEAVSTMFSIVDLIASKVASVDWHLYRKAPSGKKEDRTEIFDHPALVAWNKPAVVDGQVIYTQDELIEACLAPETRILTEDLKWVPVGDLQVGDKLVGFDEHNNGQGKARNWRTTTVTATGRQMLPSSLVTLRDGTQIIASNQHPWLVSTTKGNVQRWVTTSDLMPPEKQKGRGRRRIKPHAAVRLLDVWDQPRSYEAGYVAGMYDGEGSYSYREGRAPVLTIGQKDNEALFELETALDRMGFITKRYGLKSDTEFFSLHVVGGQPEYLRLLGSTRPKRLLEKWREAGSDQMGGLRAKGAVEVISVEPIGLHEVVTLSTSTRTYVAEGYAMHNSQQHYELTGETWLVLEESSLGRLSAVTGMWPVRPDRMAPVKDRTNFLAGYVYAVGDEKIPLRTDQVLFDRRQNPRDPWRGLSPIPSLMLDIEGEKAAAAWNYNFFANGALPGGVLELERETLMDDAEWEEWVQRWRTQHQGVSNAHRVAVMEMGKFSERKITQRDMEFTGLRTFSRESMMEAYRISKANLGHVDDVNRANNEGQLANLTTNVVVPRSKRWRKLLNVKYLPHFDTPQLPASDYEFDFTDPTPVDAADARLQARADVLNFREVIQLGANWDASLEAFNLPSLPRDFIPPSLSGEEPEDSQPVNVEPGTVDEPGSDGGLT